MLTDVDDQQLGHATEKLACQNLEVDWQICDVSKSTQIAATAQKTIDKLGSKEKALSKTVWPTGRDCFHISKNGHIESCTHSMEQHFAKE